MPECTECGRFRLSYTQAARQLATAQEHLAQYRPAADHAFPSLWAECMEALGARQTLHDQMLWHLALHTASPERARVAAAS